MMNKLIFATIVSFCILASCANPESDRQTVQSDNGFQSRYTTKQLNEAPLKLIPFPQEVKWSKKKLIINSIEISDTELLDKNILQLLKTITKEFNISINTKGDFQVRFFNNPDLSNEAYHLEIENHEIQITSSSNAGAFYAVQTLRQLLNIDKKNTLVQKCIIKDYPMHSIRGYMLDVGRNYQSMNSLKQQFDIMAMYKLNVFHWHLTDRPAWRIESHIYPELTAAENHRPGRDPGKFYSYNEIRELIAYARNLNIQIIPEIDMPGHSDSFVTSMGVKMESEKGMEILEDVLNEFFKEITVEDCPIIHLGSDEVHIPNPDQFINKMVSICEDHNRKVMIWNPGLKANDAVIRQTWQAKHVEKGNYLEVDSWNNYVNNDDPHNTISKLFFKPIGFGSENEVIGSILCLWPDVNLDNELDAFRINPLYPALVTHAWACWTADVVHPHNDYLTLLPTEESIAANYFEAYENYILDHKKRYFSDKPFPYYYQSDKTWKVALGKTESDDDNLDWMDARGNTLIFKDRFKLGGYFPEAKPGAVAFAETIIMSGSNQEIEVLLGFETPLRANRVYSGMPENGSWDPNGGKIWVNGKELPGPEWIYPGWKPSKTSGWGSKIDQEIPWRGEELYWIRKPAKIKLKEGQNTIRIMAPYVNDYQNWMVTFIPLD